MIEEERKDLILGRGAGGKKRGISDDLLPTNAGGLPPIPKMKTTSTSSSPFALETMSTTIIT
jgi:hypothetical protein